MPNTISMYSKANSTHANNIAKKEVPGAKKDENVFVDSNVGKGNNSTTYVYSLKRSTNDVQGPIISTGIISDIGIDGAGLLIVADSVNGVNKFSRRGDFRQDELGFWKNGAGLMLKAWKLDNEGNLPQNSSQLSSLEAVNFANTKGTPVATSIISIAMNLNSGQSALRGNGVDTVLNRQGKNAVTNINSIIFPEKLANTGLTIGDSFTFTSSTTNISREITYGGIVMGKKPSSTEKIFGAPSANRTFLFNDPQNGNLPTNSVLKIALSGGQSYTFTAVQGAENPKDKTFNTINGLAAAINRISSLQAAVDQDGRLYIAPINADSGLSFTGGALVEALGLTNLEKSSGSVSKFNSLATLRDAGNSNQETYSLKATVEGKDLKMTALLATADFTVKANSFGIRGITNAVVNPNEDEIGRASVYITAPENGLKSGDFVKVKGLNNPLTPDGLFVVGEVTANGFTICLKEAAANLLPQANAAPNLVLAADASWQKVAGQTYASRPATVTAVPAAAIPPAAPGPITIELPAGTTALTDAPHENWAANDVVYISGIGSAAVLGQKITVPNGYYNIVAVGDNAGARTLTIVPTAVEAPGATLPIQAFSVRKVAVGGIAALDTRVFVTTGGVDPLTSGVKMYMDNHGYALDDIISFKNLPNGLIVDGIPIENNINYKITGVGNDNGAQYLIFQVKDINGDIIPATTGDNNTDAKNYVANVNDSYINNSSQLMKYFGIDQEKTVYDRTYDSNNTDKNLSAAATKNANFPSTLVHPVPLNIYDSLGSSYPLTLYFAKLNNNEWAIELTAQKNNDGVYDITNMLTENGLIRQGIIKFDSDGKLVGVPEGFEDAISIQRNNGSAPTNLTIDWENILSDITSGSVSQTFSANNVEIIQNNGQAAGTLDKLEISNEGYIVGAFSSGETKNLYKIPLAMFANVNGLAQASNSTLEITRESGQLLLKEPTIGGAGKTLGGCLEGSNVDTTEELLKVQDMGNTIRANARVAAIDNENFKNILAELGR